MEQQVLSISQINEYIQGLMDRDTRLNAIAVRGEISNYKVYPSGHHYFTLKDEQANLKCVMFRGNAIRLRFQPENGMKIIAMGKISVYPRDGAYQLYCSAMALDGIGDLHAAFEQLKKKLSAQGLFNQEHKKKIPEFPGVIGIVTSSAGAAVHDILRILKKRYPLSKVVLLPVRVQGTEAPVEIASAIAYANQHKLADLLIVGRGGGSLEDLWAFNEEPVAYAIYNSEIPVISAVGHEPDYTISDFVADLRAATPSNAAELAVPDQDNLRQRLDSIHASLCTNLLRQIKTARQHLNALSGSATLQSPQQYIHIRRQALAHSQSRLSACSQQFLAGKKQAFTTLTAKLDAMSPLKVLSRGYALVQSSEGHIVRSVKQVPVGDCVSISVEDGEIVAVVSEKREEER